MAMMHDFDPKFYRRMYPDVSSIPRDGDLLQHYTQHGRKEGRFANGSQMLASLKKQFGSLPVDFDARQYRLIHTDLRVFNEDWELAAHFLQYGRTEQRSYRLDDAHYERALESERDGRHSSALEFSENALAKRPDDVRAILLSARMLIRLGNHKGAADRLDTLRQLDPRNADLPWMEEFNLFMRRFPISAGERMALEIEGGANHLDPTAFANRIDAALEARRGFSFVRIGDGEGAFMRISDQDELEFANLHRRNREDRAHVWFNKEIDLYASGFVDVASQISQVMQRADVVGLPHLAWVRHEYSIVSPTGISALVNALRAYSDLGETAERATVSQVANIDLYTSGLLTSILERRREIALISCHTSLPELVMTTFDIPSVDFYRIPGEKGHREILGETATLGCHFPLRFHELVQQLSKNQGGKLFLVSGGILGKIYCDVIKRHGGVALDIGSLVDGWVGVITRPGFTANNFALKRE